jgi:sugar phosphate isomerase/epimerase
MRIGLKLDIDFDTNESYRRLFGGRDVPSRLSELGVQAVEIPLGPFSDLGDVGDKARLCHRVGLQVSFHPYTEGHETNPAYFSGPESQPAMVHQRFLALAAGLARQQGETIVNIHPAADANRLRRGELMERSVQFFSWTRDWCAERAPHVRPVAELQVSPEAAERLVRVGDSPFELAQIVERSGVAACWDVGHAVWNHRRFDTPQDPPNRLWERIAHVHCHDVGRVDHRVLRRGDAHWQRFLQKLLGFGFTGTVVVEVAAQTFLDAGGLTALEESITALSETEFPPGVTRKATPR